MRKAILGVLAAILVAGCQSNPPKPPPPIGKPAEAPAGKDGVVVDHLPRVASEHRMRSILGIAQNDPDIIIEEHVSDPVRKPTVKVKYSGRVKEGHLEDLKAVARYRRKTVEGKTVTYYTDLSQMTLIMERQVRGQPYDYRELTMVVPYGYCLDFIIENIGKTSDGGYVLRSVQCDQENLANTY